MQREQICRLLLEAKEASDVRDGLLHSYEDLQDVLRHLADATAVLLAENERLEGRLRRGAGRTGERSTMTLSCS